MMCIYTCGQWEDRVGNFFDYSLKASEARSRSFKMADHRSFPSVRTTFCWAWRQSGTNFFSAARPFGVIERTSLWPRPCPLRFTRPSRSSGQPNPHQRGAIHPEPVA